MDDKRQPILESSRSSSSRHSSCSSGCREGFLKIACQSLWDAEKGRRLDDGSSGSGSGAGLEGLLLVTPVSLMFDPILTDHHRTKDEKTDERRLKETVKERRVISKDKSREALTVHLDRIATIALYSKNEELDKKTQVSGERRSMEEDTVPEINDMPAKRVQYSATKSQDSECMVGDQTSTPKASRFQNFRSSLREKAGTIIHGTQSLGNTVIHGTQSLGSTVIQGTQTLGNTVIQGTQTLGNTVIQGTQTLGSTVIQGTQSIGNTVMKGTQNIGNTVRQENLGESFIQGTQNLGGTIIQGTQAIGTSLLTGTQNVGDSLLHGTQAVGRTLSTNARKIPKNFLSAQQTLDEFFEQKEFAATKFEEMQEKRSKKRAALVERLIWRTNEIRMKAQSSDASFLECKSLNRNKSQEKSPQNSDFDEYCSTNSFLFNNLTLTDSSNNIFYLYIKVYVCDQRNSFSSSIDEAFEQDEKQQQPEEQIEMSTAKNKQKPRRSISESYIKIKEYLFRSRDNSISRDLFSFLAQYWPKRSSSMTSMTVIDISDKTFCSSASDGSGSLPNEIDINFAMLEKSCSSSNEANDAATLLPAVSNFSSTPKNKSFPDHYLQEYAIITDEKILKNRRPFCRRTNSENLPFAAGFEVIFDEEVGRLCDKNWEISTIGDILEQLRFAEMQAFDDETGYLPSGAEQSKILTEDMIRQLSLHLPARAQGYSWILAYSTEQHGFGLSTLYRNMSLFNDLSPTLLIIRDKNQKIFGAIVSCPLKLSDVFYGSGESLLFTFAPAADDVVGTTTAANTPSITSNANLAIFHWTGCNRFVAKGDKDGLALGSGQGSFGLFLDDDLNRGRTRHCETFNNRPLTDENFFVADLEAFVFGIDE